MNFLLYCVDKPGHSHVRAENRPAHVDYLNSKLDSILIGGPMLSDGDATPLGSMLVIEAADRAEAEAFAANDPYAKAGLFESVTISAYKKVFP